MARDACQSWSTRAAKTCLTGPTAAVVIVLGRSQTRECAQRVPMQDVAACSFASSHETHEF